MASRVTIAWDSLLARGGQRLHALGSSMVEHTFTILQRIAT